MFDVEKSATGSQKLVAAGSHDYQNVCLDCWIAAKWFFDLADRQAKRSGKVFSGSVWDFYGIDGGHDHLHIAPPKTKRGAAKLLDFKSRAGSRKAQG